MAQADLTFSLRGDLQLTTPRAKTPTAWLTFGFHQDLNEAMRLALADMLVLMGELLAVSRKETLALASVVVDLRVTQVVNGVCGVHAVLPHGAVR
jgi:acetamidase/formamidase